MLLDSLEQLLGREHVVARVDVEVLPPTHPNARLAGEVEDEVGAREREPRSSSREVALDQREGGMVERRGEVRLLALFVVVVGEGVDARRPRIHRRAGAR